MHLISFKQLNRLIGMIERIDRLLLNEDTKICINCFSSIKSFHWSIVYDINEQTIMLVQN